MKLKIKNLVYVLILCTSIAQAETRVSAFKLPDGYAAPESQLIDLFLDPARTDIPNKERKLMQVMHRSLTCRYQFMVFEYFLEDHIDTIKEKMKISRELGNKANLDKESRLLDESTAMLRQTAHGREVWGDWFVYFASMFNRINPDSGNNLLRSKSYSSIDQSFRKKSYGMTMQKFCPMTDDNIPETVAEYVQSNR